MHTFAVESVPAVGSVTVITLAHLPERKPAVVGLLRATNCGGQETQGRTHRLHAQVSRHAQCCAPTADPMEPKLAALPSHFLRRH
jgi:hypothetical protein